MKWVAVEEILQREIGLDVRSIGTSAIEAAVHARQAECDLSTFDSYLNRLRTSPQELRKLIEEIN